MSYRLLHISLFHISASSSGVAVGKNSLFNPVNPNLKPAAESEEIGFLFEGGGKAGGHWSVADDNPTQQV